jgi:hypothetical protein
MSTRLYSLHGIRGIPPVHEAIRTLMLQEGLAQGFPVSSGIHITRLISKHFS